MINVQKVQYLILPLCKTTQHQDLATQKSGDLTWWCYSRTKRSVKKNLLSIANPSPRWSFLKLLGRHKFWQTSTYFNITPSKYYLTNKTKEYQRNATFRSTRVERSKPWPSQLAKPAGFFRRVSKHQIRTNTTWWHGAAILWCESLWIWRYPPSLLFVPQSRLRTKHPFSIHMARGLATPVFLAGPGLVPQLRSYSIFQRPFLGGWLNHIEPTDDLWGILGNVYSTTLGNSSKSWVYIYMQII